MKLELIHTIKAEEGTAFGEAWSPNGKFLAIAGLGSGPQVWDAASARLRVTAEHPELVECIDWSPNGFTLAAGSSAGEILLIDAMSGRIKARTVGHRDEVRSVAYSPDGRLVASVANDGTLGIWSAVDASRQTRTVRSCPAVARLCPVGDQDTDRVTP